MEPTLKNSLLFSSSQLMVDTLIGQHGQPVLVPAEEHRCQQDIVTTLCLKMVDKIALCLDQQEERERVMKVIA